MLTEPQPSGGVWPSLTFLDEPAMRSLNDLICSLAVARELPDTLRLISEELRALLGARFVAVVLFDSERTAPAGNGTDPAVVHFPLIVADRHIGDIKAFFDQPRDLSHAQARVLELVAAVAALALDNARLRKHERQRLDQMGATLPLPEAAPEYDVTRGDLLASVVHDLRGPLSVIKGYAATLLRLGERLDLDKRHRFVAGIDGATDQMAQLLDQLAALSRLETGRLHPKPVAVDLAQLVAETIEQLRPTLGEHPISLELPGEVLVVYVDHAQIGKALGNILSSAGRLATEGGKIDVLVSQRNDLIKGRQHAANGDETERPPRAYGMVVVHAEGPGLPPDEAKRVFDRLHRLPSTDPRKRGTGLELYVARKTVEAHHGRVWAESEAAHGVTFHCLLPLSNPD